MGHDASLILLGSTQSSVKEVTCETGDPATFKAGLAVRKATTGALQIADDSVAVLIGVSLGPDLADTKKTSVARTGNFVPIVILNDAASVKIEDITFTAKLFGALGNAITITISDTETGNVAEVDVDDTDIVIAIEAGVTTTTVIAAAILASAAASALITAAIDSGDEAAVVAAATITSLTGGSDVAVVGTGVFCCKIALNAVLNEPNIFASFAVTVPVAGFVLYF